MIRKVEAPAITQYLQLTNKSWYEWHISHSSGTCNYEENVLQPQTICLRLFMHKSKASWIDLERAFTLSDLKVVLSCFAEDEFKGNSFKMDLKLSTQALGIGSFSLHPHRIVWKLNKLSSTEGATSQFPSSLAAFMYTLITANLFSALFRFREIQRNKKSTEQTPW